MLGASDEQLHPRFEACAGLHGRAAAGLRSSRFDPTAFKGGPPDERGELTAVSYRSRTRAERAQPTKNPPRKAETATQRRKRGKQRHQRTLAAQPRRATR